MSEIMTVASLRDSSGFMDYGRLTRAEIIRRTKEVAAQEKAHWKKILAAPDEEFDVRVVRGKLVQHLVERLEP